MAEGKSALASVTETQAERRRSHRVHIAMPVLIRGKRAGQPFEEKTHTISVNAHGCMVRLSTPVTRAQEISIVNTKTAEELPCIVSFIGQRDGGRLEVGVEFAEPSPVFWRIAFPPEDWDPSERKRPGNSAPRPAAAQMTKR
ncbi:MAG: PilZ domain-containing protein [Acidobacteriota bacterium]|nr:PilZ domain-containing protein [Acidobacteriota bacterium]